MSSSLASYDPNQCPDPNAGIFGLPFSPEESALVLVPVPWDVTTSYRPGTANGPGAILNASHQMDVWDIDLGEPWRKGIALLPTAPAIASMNVSARRDAERVLATGGRTGGDAALEAAVVRVNEASAKLNEIVYAEVDRWIAQGKLVGLVGGDHSTPFGAIKRIAEKHHGMGVLHIDAHADLRDSYEGFVWSHASIMFNVVRRIPEVASLVQVGIRDFCKFEQEVIDGSNGRIRTFFDARLQERKLAGDPWTEQIEEIVAGLPRDVYVSFDIDGLDPSFCPNTGTPVPGGLHFYEAIALIKKVVASGRRIVGFDLNEVAPASSGGDEWDANVGARILYKLCAWALESAKA